jgi:hypothetical protein
MINPCAADLQPEAANERPSAKRLAGGIADAV